MWEVSISAAVDFAIVGCVAVIVAVVVITSFSAVAFSISTPRTIALMDSRILS